MPYNSPINMNTSFSLMFITPAVADNLRATYYYTLDGSDPLDPNNKERRIYTGAFTVIPLASKTVKLHYASQMLGYKSNSTYPDNPEIYTFNYTCNPWIVSYSSLDMRGPSVTTEGNLRINTGTVLERSYAFNKDYYFKFDVLNVVGNSSLVFGMKEYLKTLDNRSEGAYTGKWKSPTITFTDRVKNVYTCNIGYRRGLQDKNNFKKYGSFEWNVNDPLTIVAYVKDEMIIPSNTRLIDAESMYSHVLFDSTDPETNIIVDGMIGITADATKSIIIKDIPAYDKRVVLLPDPTSYPNDTSFYVTKKGSNIESELIIAGYDNISVLGSTNRRVISVKSNETYRFNNTSGQWSAIRLDDFVSYTISKKMKLSVNGIETDYEPVSNVELDYLMLNLAEVNAEDSYIEIGTITGGCL